MGESETELCQHAQQEAYAKGAEASRERGVNKDVRRGIWRVN